MKVLLVIFSMLVAISGIAKAQQAWSPDPSSETQEQISREINESEAKNKAIWDSHVEFIKGVMEKTAKSKLVKTELHQYGWYIDISATMENGQSCDTWTFNSDNSFPFANCR